MLINQFDYYLPKKLIAQSPTLPRDYCKLLIYNSKTGQIFHEPFYNIVKYLGKDDVLVLNKTRVIPVRLNFEWNGKMAEIFFIKNILEQVWEIMGSPGKMLRKGEKFMVKNSLEIEIVDELKDTYRKAKVNLDKNELMLFLKKFGKMPLPPYIKTYSNVDYYSSVFEDKGESIAAPTAGLHFTSRLINQLLTSGTEIEYINLEVGLGTFMPVKVADLREHEMHYENYQIDLAAAKQLNLAKRSGKRLIMVGTTVVRALEDNYARFGEFREGEFDTNIFISRNEQFKATNCLLTNFHLPKSTLLVLVSGLIGKENALKIYNEAVKRNYSFFSFGDAMLII